MNVKRKPAACAILLLLLLLSLAACAPQTGGSFTSGQTRRPHSVDMGSITRLEAAFINNDATGIGALGGAVVGGVAGSTLGGGTGRVLTALGGAILGGLLGTGIERGLNSKDAVEVTVQLDDGQMLAIVQELGDEERAFAVGDRVRVLRGPDGAARVRR